MKFRTVIIALALFTCLSIAENSDEEFKAFLAHEERSIYKF